MTPRSATPAETVEKRTAILGAARSLMVARGFSDIVLDEVAKEAGVAKGTLFLYFRNKEDLFSAVFEDLVDQLGGSLEGLKAGGQTGRALLEATVRTILSHFDRHRDFISQFSTGRLAGCGTRSCGKIMEKFGRNYALVVSLLRRCAADGLVEGSKVQFAGFALFGLCRSAAMRQAMQGSKSPLDRHTDEIVEFFLQGAGKR